MHLVYEEVCDEVTTLETLENLIENIRCTEYFSTGAWKYMKT